MDWMDYLELNESTLDDLRLVGYSYVKQGCYDIAIDFFKALIILNPNSIYDLQTLGALYLQKENFMLALEYLDKAIKLAPFNYLAMLNKTRALFSIGYTNQAMSQAKELEKCNNKKIAAQASALIKAHV